MPTNLPPEYFAAERRYREAETVADKISCLEELIGTIPKHKGTDHLRADLRRKLSKLKSQSQTRKSTGKRDSVFNVRREGAGQVVVVGPTNAGKSALVARLTNATPEVADSPFTTWQPTPGMMLVEDVPVQLVDTPPLDRDFVEPALMALIRRADLLLLVVDLQADPVHQLEDTVTLLAEHRIAPCHRRGQYAEEERLTFVPFLVLANKSDDEGSDEDAAIFCELLEDEWPLLPISAATGRNLDRLKQAVLERLGIVRVYSKAPGKEPDRSVPFILRRGSTVAEFAEKIHRDFYEQFKGARVWGSAAYDGQMVGRDHVLCDGDVVELRI
jgi:ribosome-interacting GTPase 1